LKDRIIDLSLQAAQRLAMADQGTALVNLRVVRQTGFPGPVGSSLAGNAGLEWCVQFGAFGVRENAADLLLTLAEIFPDLQFKVIEEDGMFKVLSENLSSAVRCLDIIKKIGDYHLQGFIRKP
jgi:hypothetical protein